MTPTRLHGPVVLPDPFGRIPAGGAGGLLDVVGAASAAAAERVRLVKPLSEGRRSLRHGESCRARTAVRHFIQFGIYFL